MSTEQHLKDLKKDVKELAQEARRCQIAEKRLQESEEKYRTLVKNSLTGIYVDQGGKIVFANERFADIYGYPLEEILGIDSRRLVHPEDRDMTDTIREKRLEGKDAPTEYEARGIRKDKKTIWVRRRNTNIFYEGVPAILGNIVDITEGQEVKAELQRANRELQTFVDMVSHDMKTPIIAIQGFSNRLFKHYGDQIDDKSQKYLAQIKKSADRMEGLVSDLLNLAQCGKMVSEYEKVSSKDIVESVKAILENQLKKKNVDLVVSKDLPVIYTDKQAIIRVFQNLLDNAIKYSSKTSAPKIEIGYEDKDSFFRFHIKDNGVGIDPKYHESIFYMFRRSEISEGEPKKRKGTGLGLAIVKRIIHAHGGTIGVTSAKGQGAEFYFTLPKKSAAICSR